MPDKGAKKRKQLDLVDRYKIEAYYKMWYSYRKIWKELWRWHKTIGREIKRNWYENKWWHWVYKAEIAESKKIKRKLKANRWHIKLLKRENYWFYEKIKKMLSCEEKEWSPDAIIWRYKKEKWKQIICTSTLYRFINIYMKSWKHHLRHKWLKYKKQWYKYWKNGKIQMLKLIEERTKVIEERERTWDMELDLIVSGRWYKDVLITMVDRKSRYLMIRRAKDKSKEEVKKGIEEIIEGENIESLTTDNWPEFTDLIDICEENKIEWYRCHPYSSWEKWTNERTNGMIRWYIVKWENIWRYTESYIERVAEKINNLPRKILWYKTPEEVFYGIDKHFF